MIYPIIDASRYSIRDFESEFSRVRAWRYAFWFRFARPAMVIGMWVLAGLYLRWCVQTAQPGELAFQAFAPGLAVLACVIAAFSAWAMAYSVAEQRNRRRAAFDPMSSISYAAPAGCGMREGRGRRLVAYHDEMGAISHVATVTDSIPAPVETTGSSCAMGG
jgi:hypothetical protein